MNRRWAAAPRSGFASSLSSSGITFLLIWTAYFSRLSLSEAAEAWSRQGFKGWNLHVFFFLMLSGINFICSGKVISCLSLQRKGCVCLCAVTANCWALSLKVPFLWRFLNYSKNQLQKWWMWATSKAKSGDVFSCFRNSWSLCVRVDCMATAFTLPFNKRSKQMDPLLTCIPQICISCIHAKMALSTHGMNEADTNTTAPD